GEQIGCRNSLLGEEAFERVEPMVVIGLARIGVAARLRARDLVAERRSPFFCGEKTSLAQREHDCKRMRLPRLTENRFVAHSTPARDTAPRLRSKPSAWDRRSRPTIRAPRTARYRATAGLRRDR